MSIITMTVDDKGLIKDLNKFYNVFNKHVSRQLLGFGTFMKSEVRRQIRGGLGAEGMSGLGVQKYIKGHGRLLVHSGGFSSAAGFKYHREGPGLLGIDVGWFKGQTARGYPYTSLADTLEYGREWTPKASERLAVRIKARDAGAPPPAGDPKQTWKIPPRPILGTLIRNKVVLDKFEEAGERVIERTLKEIWK